MDIIVGKPGLNEGDVHNGTPVFPVSPLPSHLPQVNAAPTPEAAILTTVINPAAPPSNTAAPRILAPTSTDSPATPAINTFDAARETENQNGPAHKALTNFSKFDTELWDDAWCFTRHKLGAAWDLHRKRLNSVALDDGSAKAHIEALDEETRKTAHALGQQCAKEFGHVAIDLCDKDKRIHDLLLGPFLDGLAASPFIKSMRLELGDHQNEELKRTAIRLLHRLKSRPEASPLPLAFKYHKNGDEEISDESLKTLGDMLSSPALLPLSVDLKLDQIEPLMPMLAKLSSLQHMHLEFASEDLDAALALKGHEASWPNLERLLLRSTDGEFEKGGMDWAAFMKAHPQLQDISLYAVQPPLAQLLRTKLSVDCDLRPENLGGFADALAATDSLRELSVTTRDMLDASELLRGLAHNKSLHYFDLKLLASDDEFDAKVWAATIRGLKDHPGLVMLILRFPHDDKGIKAACEELRAARPEMIVDLR
ncbi:hypothetical protein [Noviherbaspirillum pedocola]|uniref:Uncharacterized protein n=1 Tax=Noviherbaspirillum pedocola TaxID=2801341 RepID=A0A934SWF4_9BURK|nr:hypothetical protein [Noviherbaspirillum pedocola]MBK4733949.1 hypothetical protein [Noviherbaspirillum pedocola]